MKKLLLLIAILWMGNTAIAQEAEPLYLIFEFMHVDNEQEMAYAETEAFWEKIHEQRIKNGDALGWDLWRILPGGENQGSQYFTVSLYNDPVKMMEGPTWKGITTAAKKAYPKLSEEEIMKKSYAMLVVILAFCLVNIGCGQQPEQTVQEKTGEKITVTPKVETAKPDKSVTPPVQEAAPVVADAQQSLQKIGEAAATKAAEVAEGVEKSVDNLQEVVDHLRKLEQSGEKHVASL